MKAKVISGEVFDVKGPIVARTPTYFIDFHFENAETSYTHVIPKGWNSMIVVHSGSITVQDSDTVYKAINAVVYSTS